MQQAVKYAVFVFVLKGVVIYLFLQSIIVYYTIEKYLFLVTFYPTSNIYK